MKKNAKIKKYLSVALILILISFCSVFFSSCSPQTETKDDLVVWTGMTGPELDTLKEITKKFNKENNLKVSVIKVPFNELKIKFQVAAPAGQGPDLLTGPHDWVGFLATARLISPLNSEEFTSSQQKKYNPVGLESMTYGGNIYGVPFFMETLAIIYNKDIIKNEPSDMNQLLEKAVDFNDPAKGRYGFFFEISNMYFAWPFLAGYGSEMFGIKDGKIDIDDIRLDSPQTIEGMEFLRNLKTKYRLIPDGATTDMMNGIFYDGKMAFCINGPWMLGELRKKKINFGVMPLPQLPNGKMPRPFVGIQGVMLNQQAKNRPLAIKFMHYLNQPENQKALCFASGRIPSRYDTLDLIKDEKEILQFAKAAEIGIPMPNHPAMSAVWGPMSEALILVIKDGRSPQEVLPIQVKRIQDDIKIMTE